MAKKILVAGGAGYVGNVLVRALMAGGHEVSIVDLLWFGNHLPSDAQLHHGDIFSLSMNDLVGFDTVVFLAGLSNDPMADFSPGRNFIENTSGPAYLCYLAKAAGVKRFIHGGSCSVYGALPRNVVATEETKPKSAYPYGMSKLYAEHACLDMVSDNFSVICFRKGTISGWSPRMRFDLIINAMVKDALTKRTVTINDPKAYRPILSINDAVEAYKHAIEADQKISGVFNIASQNVDVATVARIVRKTVGDWTGETVESECLFKNDPRSYRVDTKKARRVLKMKFLDRVEDIATDVLTYMDRVKDVNDPQHYNIATFKAQTIDRAA